MTDKKMMTKSADHKNLEIIVTNGYDKDSFVQGVQNSIHASPSLNGQCTEEVKSVEVRRLLQGAVPLLHFLRINSL